MHLLFPLAFFCSPSPLGSKVLAFDIVENKGYKGFVVLYNPTPANTGKLLGDSQPGWCYYDMMTEGQKMPFVGDVDIHSHNPNISFFRRLEVLSFSFT
jgi:hypothetical protein